MRDWKRVEIQKRAPLSHGFLYYLAISATVFRDNRETTLLIINVFHCKGASKIKKKTRESVKNLNIPDSILTYPEIFHNSPEKTESSKSFSHFTMSWSGNKEYCSVYFRDEELNF